MIRKIYNVMDKRINGVLLADWVLTTVLFSAILALAAYDVWSVIYFINWLIAKLAG